MKCMKRTAKYCDAYQLLDNGPVNIFPLKRVTTVGSPLLGNVSVNTPGRQLRISVAGRSKHVFRGYGVISVFSVRGPRRRFIRDNESRLQSVVEREAE
jgi:hypothetical protein